jgi:hypothetical protein
VTVSVLTLTWLTHKEIVARTANKQSKAQQVLAAPLAATHGDSV